MLNACTIIARNYYPFARVLADSFFVHHPDGSFTVLIIDDEARRFSPEDTRIDWRRLSDLGIEHAEIHRLAGIYDVTELATAVKPRLLRRLLDEGKDHVVYLDPDTQIYDSLEEVGLLARQHDVVLTPHTLKPFPKDDCRVDRDFILAAGVYNLGFVGVATGSRPFLDWWWQSTRREALIDVAKMMFTGQRWVDFVPSFFEHRILEDPTCNVACWNLHARTVTWDGRRYLVDGAPLRFFHFSGFDFRKPWLLSKHQGERPRILLSEHPALAQICREYVASLGKAGIDAHAQEPYGWGRTASGMPLIHRIRRLYWDGLAAAEAGQGPEPPDPFDAAHPTAFIDWLNSSEEGGLRGVSRFLYSIYRDRLDLQSHFREIDRADDFGRYATWIRGVGVDVFEIPSELLPPRDRDDARVGGITPAGELTEGINVAGYFRAELGLGEAARLLMSAVQAAGISHSTSAYGATLSRQAHPFVGRPTNDISYGVNVLCINAGETPRFASDAGPDFFIGRHTVGYWFWEIAQFPATMHAAFDVVDEVWAATDFIVDAVRAAGRKPVFRVPLPVAVPRYQRAITRERLGLPDRFTFLFMFDFFSVMERKNPLGLIDAFTRAFSPGEGPILLLKTINGGLKLGELERLRAAAGERHDIVIVDAYYSAEETNALLGLCDCYVSLHRSEGLGLTMAEAMALGKPVVATGYSGNLHYMTPDNSYLVDYATVSVPAGCDPYPVTAVWAAPNLDQAARLMRAVYEQPAEAAARARRGQADVLERHSIHVTVRAIVQRLEHIRRDRRGRVAVALTGDTSAVPT